MEAALKVITFENTWWRYNYRKVFAMEELKVDTVLVFWFHSISKIYALEIDGLEEDAIPVDVTKDVSPSLIFIKDGAAHPTLISQIRFSEMLRAMTQVSVGEKLTIYAEEPRQLDLEHGTIGRFEFEEPQ